MRPSVEEVNCSGTSRMLACPASARRRISFMSRVDFPVPEGPKIRCSMVFFLVCVDAFGRCAGSAARPALRFFLLCWFYYSIGHGADANLEFSPPLPPFRPPFFHRNAPGQARTWGRPGAHFVFVLFSPPAVYRAARATQVALPTLPSTVRPRLRWNVFTAVSVLLPK